jgi:hypothetical protein
MTEQDSNEMARLMTENDSLRSELAATVRAMNENARLVLEAQEELKDINDTYNSIVNESCNGTDNRQHCACVPALRAEIKRLNKVDENLEQSLET